MGLRSATNIRACSDITVDLSIVSSSASTD
jgi:hypothetical protein